MQVYRYEYAESCYTYYNKTDYLRVPDKGSPCIPEVAIRMTELPEMQKSYSHVLMYPPQPAAMVEYAGRQQNFTSKMYGFYLEEKRQQVSAGAPIAESFLQWHRSRQYNTETARMDFRGGQHNQHSTKTLVVACRYWYELTDGFWGQLVLTQIPHTVAKDILPSAYKHLESMQNFAGMLEYASTWK